MTYRIADLIVQMDAGGRTARQAEPYRIADGPTPDVVIQPNLPAYRELYAKLTEDDSEYMATGAVFYSRLLDHDGLLLHASCVVLDGKAYLFSAPCGTGKSTHTAFWLSRFGERAYILNDDKPALRLVDGKWFVYGTPWSGKNDISRNARVPLGGIGILRRGDKNHAEKITGAAAAFGILDQTIRPRREERMQTVMALVGKLVETGRIYQVTATLSPEAAEVASGVMCEE